MDGLADPSDHCYPSAPDPMARREAAAKRRSCRCETDLPTPRNSPQAYPWLSRAHGDATRSQDPVGSPSARTQAPRGHDRAQVMKPEGFPRCLRLRRRREFLRVQRSGRKHHTRFFLVFVAPSGLGSPGRRGRDQGAPPGSQLPSTRLGVTVTRKVGKAVKRNRIKRLVREAFRRERSALPPGLDMVWVAKRDAVDTTFEAVVHDMRTLAGRLSPPRSR